MEKIDGELSFEKQPDFKESGCFDSIQFFLKSSIDSIIKCPNINACVFGDKNGHEMIKELIFKRFIDSLKGIKTPQLLNSLIENAGLYEHIKQSVSIEYKFVCKVLKGLERILENLEGNNVILFDIDGTIARKIMYKNHEIGDIFRPGFFIIIEELKEKYGDKIDFGILSARKDIVKDFKAGKKTEIGQLSNIFNKEHIYSSFGFTGELIENNKYQSENVVFPELYSQKVNALSEITKSNKGTKNFILIDDIIEGGKLEEFGEGISVAECGFYSDIIGIGPGDYS